MIKHDHVQTKVELQNFGTRESEVILHLEKNNSYQESDVESIFGCQYCSMSRLTWTGLMEHINMMHQSLTDPNVLEKLTEDI